MKFKRKAGLILFAPLFLLTACTSTPALTFSANWYMNTNNYGGISGTYEELTYAVTFAPANETADYRVEYDEGTYTTKLTSTNITEAEGNPLGYCYETNLSIKGRYYVKGEKADEFTDAVTTKVYFLGIQDELRPVMSERTVYCTSPNVSATVTSEASVVYHYKYSVSYDADLSNATVVYENLKSENGISEESTVKLSGKGSYLDNEQLLFALRGLALNSSFTFRTWDSVTGKVRTVTTSDTPTAEQYTATFSVQTEGGEAKREARTLEAVRFTAGFSGSNPGEPQTYIYARCTNIEANTYRNVLLHMEVQALASLGTFSYDLKEAVFNNK